MQIFWLFFRSDSEIKSYRDFEIMPRFCTLSKIFSFSITTTGQNVELTTGETISPKWNVKGNWTKGRTFYVQGKNTGSTLFFSANGTRSGSRGTAGEIGGTLNSQEAVVMIYREFGRSLWGSEGSVEPMREPYTYPFTVRAVHD